MAALLTAQQITAVETRIASLTTLAGEIRDTMNGLYAANGACVNHAAWVPLKNGLNTTRQAILNLRAVVMANEDAYTS